MKYLLLFFTGVLLLTGCTDSGVNVPPDKQTFLLEGNTLLPSQKNSTWWKMTEDKAKLVKPSLSNLSTEQVSELYKILDEYSQKKNTPYVAFLSSKKNSKDGKKDKKFKYRYFKLKPNEDAINKSEGEKAFYFHIFVDSANHEIYQILAVLVPKTEEQIEIVKEWGDKLNSNASVRVDSSANRNKSLTCSYTDGLVWVPECGVSGCFGPGTVEICAPSDYEELDPNNDGGGDGTTGCYYEPQGCEEDPDPNDPPGGGGSGDSDDPDPDNCPVGQVEDTNGDCIDGEMPCVGNPVKNPRIAEQANSGIEGGRKGYTRSQGTQFHSGLDLRNDSGKPWFSPFSGNIDAFGEDKDGLGWYVTIRLGV